jgi:hypothetical protein
MVTNTPRILTSDGTDLGALARRVGWAGFKHPLFYLTQPICAGELPQKGVTQVSMQLETDTLVVPIIGGWIAAAWDVTPQTSFKWMLEGYAFPFMVDGENPFDLSRFLVYDKVNESPYLAQTTKFVWVLHIQHWVLQSKGHEEAAAFIARKMPQLVKFLRDHTEGDGMLQMLLHPVTANALKRQYNQAMRTYVRELVHPDVVQMISAGRPYRGETVAFASAPLGAFVG